jgi:hypothetical protein
MGAVSDHAIVMQGAHEVQRRVSSLSLFCLLTVLLFALGPVATAASSENYGEYSLMTQRHAGEFYSGGLPFGQWSWTPQGNESLVVWVDLVKRSPENPERFLRTGDWVLLDGYGRRGVGPYNVQRVSRELIGEGTCRNMVPLPSDEGRQHYVQWKIPPHAYCLQAWGTITDQLSGKIVDFYHSQIWSPPGPCRNVYLGAQTCIRQRETWSDNNGAPGSPLTRKLERDVYLARGIGMAFAMDQTFPRPSRVELHSHWVW